MTSTPADDLAKAARDSFHVTVGLGLIAFQRIQVRRQELRRQIDSNRGSSPLGGAGKALGDNLKMIEERVADAEERLDAALDDVETRLPDPAREAVAAARSAAKEARSQLRKLL